MKCQFFSQKEIQGIFKLYFLFKHKKNTIKKKLQCTIFFSFEKTFEHIQHENNCWSFLCRIS